MNGNIMTLMPVFIFMIAMLAVSIYLRSASKKENTGFLTEYFIGSRSLGGFVLAMTTVATYSSVSSFVGGPGQAWNIGFGWIYMSVVQVTALFLVLGVLGKKMAIVSRKIDAVTVIDVIRAVRCTCESVCCNNCPVFFCNDGCTVCRRSKAV